MPLLLLFQSQTLRWFAIGFFVPGLETVSSASPLIPKQYNPNQIFLIGDGFGLFVYFEKFEETHFKNGIIKRPNAKAGTHGKETDLNI